MKTKHSETINGLHSCKPENEPVAGETKTFVIEQHPAKNGKKAWIKIKSAGQKFGGEPYRIISAEPTGYTDDYGNVSFNLEIEPALGTDRAAASESPTVPGEAETKSGGFSRGRDDLSPDLNGVEETRRHIMQSANLMLMSMESAKWIAEQWRERHGYEIPNEHFQGLCHSLFIEANGRRTSDGVNWWSYVDKMPDHPIKKPVHDD